MAAPPSLGGELGGCTILAPLRPEYAHILTPPALEFVARLSRAFAPRARALLAARAARQARFDAGERPHFLPETRAVREGAWRVAPAPPDLRDRRVEITGPTDAKMVINALNSGASVDMPGGCSGSGASGRRPGAGRF